MAMTKKVTLKREIGLLGSFSMGFADVGADVFLAIGLVALYAAGYSPLAFLIASICYITTGLVYAELSELYPYAGGAQVYGTKAGGDLLGFLMGWAILLDYTLGIALFSIAAAGYLSFIFPTIETPIQLFGLEISGVGTTAFIIILFLIGINIIGIKESSNFNVAMVLLTIVTEIAVLILGFIFAFDLGKFLNELSIFGNPDPIKYVDYTGLLNIETENFLYGVTLAMSSYIGIESIAQAAEETRNPWKHLHSAFKIGIVAVVFFTISFSVLGLGVLGWKVLANEAYNPIATIASRIPVIGGIFSLGVAIVAFAINTVSTNTGVIGVSRVVYSMSRFDMLPKVFSKLHPTRATPYVSIIVFSLIGGSLAITGEIHFVASLYNFGALLSYFLVNYSHIRLRSIDRNAYRNWKTPLNIEFRGTEYSLIALLGVISTGTLFSLVLLYHPDGRTLGIAWMVAGLLLYILYRRWKGWGLVEYRSAEAIPPATPHLHTAVVLTPDIDPEKVAEAIRIQLPRIHKIYVVGNLMLSPKTSSTVGVKLALDFENDLERLVEILEEMGYVAEHRIVVGGEEQLLRLAEELQVDQIAYITPKRARRKAFERRLKRGIRGVETIYLYI